MAGSESEEPAIPNMTTISRHNFGDDTAEPVFSISIIENMKEEYGLFVWPCSIVLAEYVWQQRLRFSRSSVVELGAGTCLPGLVAAKVGADVTLTDDANSIEVIDNMRRVCDLNKLKCNVIQSLLFYVFMSALIVPVCERVLGMTWGVWDASIFSLQPKIILGADVLYDTSGRIFALRYVLICFLLNCELKYGFHLCRKAFDDLFATVKFLLQNSPGSVFITTYHNRSGHHLIEFLMVKWGLKCIKLLDGFSLMPSDKASGLSGNIQLAEIVLNNLQP